MYSGRHVVMSQLLGRFRCPTVEREVSTGVQRSFFTAETYSRRPNHQPCTPDAETDMHILTLKTDQKHYEHMTELRKSYFPPGLFKVNAHVTLFHALPQSHLAAIEADISTIARYTIPFVIHAIQPHLLGIQGVVLHVQSKRATSIYNHLRDQWLRFLSRQDRIFKPHYLVQNKVDKATAETTLEALRRKFLGSSGVVEGLSLHRHDRGFWRPYRSWSFQGVTTSRRPSWLNDRGEKRVEGVPNDGRQNSDGPIK